MTISNLSLEFVSDPELIKFTHYQNSFTWKSKLTHEEYMEREWKVGVESKPSKRDETNNTGIFHFVLRDLSVETNGDKFINIVASCETRNRKALKAEKGVLKELISPCIGSVYTLPNHRKKGYAHKMIELLNDYWAERLEEDSFMTLYSEVGHYYNRVGFDSHEVKVHKVPVVNSVEGIKEFEYTDLEFESYESLITDDNNELISKLVEKSKESSFPLYSLNMDLDIFTWYHLRDLYIGSRLKPTFQIKELGALLKDSNKDHIIWLHDWNSESLTIIKLQISSFDSFKYLFELASKEARSADLKEINLWDTALGEDESLHQECLDYISKFKGSLINQPNGSLSGFKLLNNSKNYKWENNDKWCWF